jgi:hypothetical protein
VLGYQILLGFYLDFNTVFSQEEEIRRLLEINQTLSERLKQKESTIDEMEDVLQVSESKLHSELHNVENYFQ